MKHPFYIINGGRPLGRIVHAECELIVTKKRSWAVHHGHRRLIGSTAFYTRKAAERVKLAELKKLCDKTPDWLYDRNYLNSGLGRVQVKRKYQDQIDYYESHKHFPVWEPRGLN